MQLAGADGVVMVAGMLPCIMRRFGFLEIEHTASLGINNHSHA
jgi:hypothetical protein